MIKDYTSLGLMSGTSGDGVDASIINSDGRTKYEVILNEFFEYDKDIFKKIHHLKEKINSSEDIKSQSNYLNDLEKKITLFHAKVVNEISTNKNIDIVGFHGQTIFHNPKEKISKQLGNGDLLSQLIRKNIVFNFRENDIKNGGEGAPLASIFHQLILLQNKIEMPSCILNIGGISNITVVNGTGTKNLISKDIGPGNFMIDSWVRKNSNFKYDKDGLLASKGEVNEIILEQAQELYLSSINKKTFSFDVGDFDISFARGLSLQDGSATLTDFTAKIISASLSDYLPKKQNNILKVYISGGGRKNKYLVNSIKKNILKKINFRLIDDIGVDGDFVESQAFAYLAIRTLINEPISFPNTTGCKIPSIGGQIIKFK